MTTTGTPLGAFLCPPGYAGPTGVRALARESSVVAEAARYARRTASSRIRRSGTPYAQRAPEHALAPVVLVPGLLAGDGSLRLMSGQLRALGIRAVMGEDCTSGECARLSWEQTRVPLAPTVSFTSVYSRRDGIVDWRSCLDPAATTVEGASSHVGMACDPLVLDVVAGTLASTEEHRRAGRLSPRATSRAARGASAG